MTTGWKTVLDDQLDLYRFWTTPRGQLAAETFKESLRAVALEVGGPQQVAAEESITGNLLKIETLKAFACEPIYVADEMMDLIETAAELFKPEQLQPSDLVTMNGFLVLPRPMFMYDRHEMKTSFRLITWYPMKHKVGASPSGETFTLGDETEPDEVMVAPDGILLSLYSHVDDQDDYSDREGPEYLEQIRALHRVYGTPYALTHITGWTFSQRVPALGEAGYEAIRGGWWKNVQALLRVMMQTISERGRERGPRAAGRRWQRERPNFEPYVTVVRLRRPRQKGQDGVVREVEWQKRWLVSGHWRQQWFPSLGPSSDPRAHRQIWISPYVKGPEDKPLVIRKGHAFEFVK